MMTNYNNKRYFLPNQTVLIKAEYFEDNLYSCRKYDLPEWPGLY